MKILIFMPSLAGGGAERTIVNLSNEFSHLGNEVHIVLGNESIDLLRSSKYLKLVSNHVTVHHLDSIASLKNGISIILQLRKKIREISPDIVFTTRLPSNLLTIISLFGIRKNIKLVIRESVCRSISIKTKFSRFLIGLLYNSTDCIISLSNGVLHDMVDNFGVSSKKSFKIYNPIDFELIDKMKLNYDSELNSEIQKFIFIGRFDAQKAPMEAIYAFENIQLTYPNSILNMYGIGPLVDDVKNYIEDNNLTKVIYNGFTDNPYKAFSQSDFFLMPSKFEGFGHVIVESISCNCLPIVYDCPFGPSEILSGELKSLLIPLNDWRKMSQRVVELIEDQSQILELKRYALNTIKKFDKKLIAREYLSLFMKIKEN